MKKNHDRKKRAEIQFKEGDAVYTKNFGSGPKWVEGTVVGTTGPVSANVKVQNTDQIWHRHYD